MARSAQGQQEELEDDDEEHLTGDGSSSQKVKLDEANREQRVNTHRSKHSETEQRRRSKINERFQILRNLIPQNDQKRDKASFLLEVIEYIQFLHEKLQMYEQSYQGWSQGPMKLLPWRNHGEPAENIMDHHQALENGSAHENDDVISLSLPTNAQNPIESNLLATTVPKAYPHGSATEATPLTVQMHSDLFDSVMSGGMLTGHLQESLSNAENMSSHPQHEEWIDRPNESACAIPDNSSKEHAELDGGSISISNSYSQGILNTLTQVLQSSGVDMSQASVSVQIDVGRRANANATSTSTSKSHENQYVNNGVMACSGVDYCNEESEQTLKRLRTEAS